jgi:hypothetical protein
MPLHNSNALSKPTLFVTWRIQFLTGPRSLIAHVQDFRPREWFIPEGSWLLEAFQLEDKYFGGSQTQIDIYTKASAADESYFTLQVNVCICSSSAQ